MDWPELELNLSQLGFGCAPVMGRVGRREALDAMALAYDLGVTHFDVARSYGFGDAEKVLGQFIADKRDRVTVATKFGILPGGLGRASRALRPMLRVARRRIPAVASVIKKGTTKALVKGSYDLGSVARSVDTSLRELRIEALDVLFMHDCTSDDSIGEALGIYLEDLRATGKIKSWGFAAAAEDIGPVAHKMGRSPKVVQMAAGSQALGNLPKRRILHSPMALIAALLDADRRPLPWVTQWASDRRLEKWALFELLPRLLVQTVMRQAPESVVLCSMFTAAHIRSNVQAIAGMDSSSELLDSFSKVFLERIP